LGAIATQEEICATMSGYGETIDSLAHMHAQPGKEDALRHVLLTLIEPLARKRAACSTIYTKRTASRDTSFSTRAGVEGSPGSALGLAALHRDSAAARGAMQPACRDRRVHPHRLRHPERDRPTVRAGRAQVRGDGRDL